MIKNLCDQWICCSADSQIRNAVYILRQAGFRTTASCQGTQGHSFFPDPTILIMAPSQRQFSGWTDSPVKVSEYVSCLSLVENTIERLGWKNVDVCCSKNGCLIDLSKEDPEEYIRAFIKVTGAGLLNRPTSRKLFFQPPSKVGQCAHWMSSVIRITMVAASMLIYKMPGVEALQRHRVLRAYKTSQLH